MIAVLVEQMHPRVCYILETVLGEFWGLRPLILEPGDANKIALVQLDGLPSVHYGRKPHPSHPNLPCNGLLYEDNIRTADQSIDWDGPISETLSAPDTLAQIFYHLSQYELLRPGTKHQLDRHGRYPDDDGSLIVHFLLEQLMVMLPQSIQDLARSPKFDYEITIDVDHPWKYLHKPSLVRWGGLMRDLLLGRASERWRAMQSGKDPFDVLETVKRICPAEKTTAFFLVGGEHPNDSRFDISMPAYQNYVRDWQGAGFRIGVHPSYMSSERTGTIINEKDALEKVAGKVEASRQHYLRYRTPGTFRELITAGIKTDYTLCRTTGQGGVTHVAFPYRWFDLQKNVATDLRLVPAVVMDRHLLHQGLGPAKALHQIQLMITAVQAVGGRFVIILHNETFSDSGEWQGWRDEVLTPMMHFIQG